MPPVMDALHMQCIFFFDLFIFFSEKYKKYMT